MRLSNHRVLLLCAALIVLPRPVLAQSSTASSPDAPLPADANSTRLFFAPTARTLAPGAGYFGVYEIFMPQVQIGVTSRVSLGGGTPLFFGGGANHPVWLTPKVQVLDVNETQVAVGLMHFVNIGDASAGLAYGVATHGTPDGAVTIGVGVPYYRNDGYHGGDAVLMIGGERRASRRTKFITENYIFSEGALLSAGIRFLGETFSVDFAMVAPMSSDSVVAFPLINFAWKFGQ